MVEGHNARVASPETRPRHGGRTHRPSAPPRVPAPYSAQSSERVERRATFMRRSLAGADVVGALVAIAVASLLTQGHLHPEMLASTPLLVLVAKLSGLYDRDEIVLHRSTIDELPALVRLAATGAMVLWVTHTWLGRVEVAVLGVLLLVAIFAARSVARSVVSRAMSPERCIIVGDRAAIDRLTAALERHVDVVGVVPLGTGAHDTLGDMAPDLAIEPLARETRADRVLVAPSVHVDPDVPLAIVTRSKALGLHVSILPRMLEVVGSSVAFDHVNGMVMLGVNRFGLTRSSALVKRMMDVVGATLMLVAAAPVMLCAAIAIRIESPGPVLFRQRRVGRNGAPFTLLKFRSMVDGADALRAELRELSIGGDGMFKAPADPRVTRVGRFLRRTSIDELPQLLNVLKGEMSLVGPRPLVHDEDRRIAGWHRRRLHLTPGLTGPWQVLGSPERRVPLREMVTIDYLYAANWSLWSDIKVLLRTVAHVVGARGV